MKEQELRIGNLINLYREPEDKEMTAHEIKTLFVDNIHGHDEYFIELKDGFVVNITLGIEPIPLTEEWMLKFGFSPKWERYGSKGYVSKYQHGYNLTHEFEVVDFGYQATGEKWRGWIFPHVKGEEYFMACKYTEVKCVHQLQNLYFAITGNELTINTKETKSVVD